MGFRVDQLEDVYPLADFLVELLGDAAEVVIHDVADPERSIVYIHNGWLSGRKVGDAVTDQALKMMREGSNKGSDYIANYTGKAFGSREFRSATYFIENHAGELIGMLCVNICITAVDDAIGLLRSLRFGPHAAPDDAPAGASGQPARPAGIEETLQGDPKLTVKRMVDEVLSAYPVDADRLSRSEKLEAVARLDREGAFLMKGAVNIVAAQLAVSAPTLYKYLHEVRG